MSITEWVGLLLLVPMLRLVGVDFGQGSVDRLATFVASVLSRAHVPATLTAVLAVYVLAVSSRALLQRWELSTTAELSQRFALHLRERLYRAITHSPWLFFSRMRGSDFAHALTGQIERVALATSYFLRAIAQVLVTAIYLLLALTISLTMTGLAFVCGTTLVLFLRQYDRHVQQRGEQLTEQGAELFGSVTEHIASMKTARSYGAEERNVLLFATLSQRVARTYVDTERAYATATALFGIGSVLILSVMTYMALTVLELPAAAVLLLLFLFARMVPQFSTIQQSYQNFVHGLPAFADVVRLTNECEAHVAPASGGLTLPTLRDCIRLEGVSFRYAQEAGTPSVRHLDLLIPARRTTAIIGPSGAGKSTVADLVMGLLTPDAGRILVDGVPISPAETRGWRNSIGYVSQETFLFHDTVRANLLWACPAATEEAIVAALHLSAANAFVARLPDGLDTVIGDRGMLLSGGERQRLALARALLRRPAMLILDEATSALDSENERRIQRAIEELHGQMTILVITHRLSTIRDADVIHVMEDGLRVESGTWAELMNSEVGRLRTLWTAQRIDEGGTSSGQVQSLGPNRE